MQADRFKAVRRIFDDALEQPEAARAAFVAAACGEDRALAGEVVALLEYEGHSRHAETVRPFALAAEAFEAAEAGALTGQTIGRFRLEVEIASGGMGRVFKARRIDGDVEQTVALKLIRRELFNEALLKRFSDERRILASLNHPGVAHFIDAGTDEHGVPFVAMEYVDGLPLLDYCTRHTLQVRERVQLFRQILAAVSYAHRNLVVHRDLKPNNVLVTAEGQAKLLDFGIARALSADRAQTATVDRFFTLDYAAPEQLRGEPAAVACDVYALGAIMYSLLTGVPPLGLSEVSAGEAERRILNVPPDALPVAAVKRGEPILRRQSVDNIARWTKQVAGDLDAIVQKALRKEPEARYISVEQFDDDLARYLEQRPVRASGAGWWYRARKFCGRNAVAVSVAAIVATASAASVTYIVNQNSIVRRERDRAQAMLGILKNSFQSTNPAMRDAKNFEQQRILIAEAIRQVYALEKTQPDLFHSLAIEFGEIQLNLRQAREGLALIQRGNRAGYPPSDKDLLLELHALILADEYQQAQALVETNESRLGKYPDFVARKAMLLKKDRRYPEAISMFESLLADKTVPGRVIGRWPIFRDMIGYSLAESYAEAGQTQKAIQAYDDLVRERERQFGGDHPITMMTRFKRAELRFETGDTESAERELLAMRAWVESYPEQAKPLTGVYHNLIGQIFDGQERYAEAIQELRKAVTDVEAEHGPDSGQAAATHFNLAQLIANRTSDRREAYPHYLRAIAIVEKADPSHPQLGQTRLEAAKAYLQDRQNRLAQEMLAPPNAPQYFARMPESLKAEYLEVLHRAFGAQDCVQQTQKPALVAEHPQRIARTLICHYDPEGKFRQAQ